MPTFTANDYIKKLNLSGHEEGGLFAQVYESLDKVKPKDPRYANKDGTKDERNALTSIYYMLRENDFSEFHQLKSDEIWNFCDGSAFIIHMLDEKTKQYTQQLLGNPTLHPGASFQVVIKAGLWFSAELINKEKDTFGLVTCVVGPGFQYRDFQLADRAHLQTKFSDQSQLISRLTREKKTAEEKFETSFTA